MHQEEDGLILLPKISRKKGNKKGKQTSGSCSRMRTNSNVISLRPAQVSAVDQLLLQLGLSRFLLTQTENIPARDLSTDVELLFKAEEEAVGQENGLAGANISFISLSKICWHKCNGEIHEKIRFV